MSAVFKEELKRCVTSVGFLWSLLLGNGLAVWHFSEYYPLGKQLLAYSTMDAMQSPNILWGIWLAGTPANIQGFYFFMILPLLAVMPNGAALFRDLKTGHWRNYLIRVSQRQYLAAKWWTLFLSGGTVIITPLLLNFFLFANVFPMGHLQVGGTMFPLADNALLAPLIMTHPLLFNLIYLVLIFITAGLFSSLALLVTYFAEYEFIVLCAPFIMNFLLLTVAEILGLSAYAPINFIKPYGDNDGIVMCSAAAILFLMLWLSLLPLLDKKVGRKLWEG